MYCPNCNKTYTDEVTFCENCGSKLEKEQVAEPIKPADPIPQAPQVAPTPIAPPPQASSQATYQATMTPPPVAQSYQAPVAEENSKLSKTVSFGTWMGIHFLNIIPFIFSVIYTFAILFSTPTAIQQAQPVGLALLAFSVFYVILLLVWAIGKPKARSLKNYAKATLLMTLIVIVLVIIIVFAVRNMLTDLMDQLRNFDLPFDY
jgi:amino acid transporter